MYSRKRIIKDRSIIIMSIISVMAISGLVAGIMISGKNKSTDCRGGKQLREKACERHNGITYNQ